MIEADVKSTRQISAPSLGPAPAEAIIDREHLARMTLGDASLEAEVLALFRRQAELLLARMASAPPMAVAAYAHTLKGSARGIGAWRVAEAAAVVELAATAHGHDLGSEVARLAGVIGETRAAIACLLNTQRRAARKRDDKLG
jgi:HPt (histidine-containing phosphotransfer) domain-containing protein